MPTEPSPLDPEAPDVQVDQDVLIVAGWRYPLGDIESTEVKRVATAATGPILMTSIGVICLVSYQGENGLLRALLGAALLAAAAIWWTQKKPFYKVSLLLPSGEATAFESRDESAASRIRTAIEEARSSQSSS